MREPERIDIALFEILNRKLDTIMATLADLQSAVAAETTIDQSVETLLGTLSADLAAAISANDPAGLQAVLDTMNTNRAALAAAITANTPAAPSTVAGAGSVGTDTAPAT